MSDYHYCILKTKKENIEFEKKMFEGYIKEKNNCMLNYLKILNGKSGSQSSLEPEK